MNTRHWGIIGIVADYGFSALSSVCGHPIGLSDFSPEKIFLYGITIVDFGLAMFLGPGCYANDPFGTTGYVAPEICQS